MMFRTIARALPVAFRADLAEEACGSTAWVRCNATPRYSQSDLRLMAGAVFVVFGLGKFVNYGSELASFKTYGLPAPEVLLHGVVREGTVQS